MRTAEGKRLIASVFAALLGALLLLIFLLGNLAGWINTGKRGEVSVARLDSFVLAGVLPGVDSVTNLFYDIDRPTTIDVYGLPGGIAPTNAINQVLKQFGASQVIEQQPLQFTIRASNSKNSRTTSFLVVTYSRAQNSIALGYIVADPAVENAALVSLKSRMRRLSLLD